MVVKEQNSGNFMYDFMQWMNRVDAVISPIEFYFFQYIFPNAIGDLHDLDSIRDIYAFPKDGRGRDLMMDSPNEVDPEQLKETHVKIV